MCLGMCEFLGSVSNVLFLGSRHMHRVLGVGVQRVVLGVVVKYGVSVILGVGVVLMCTPPREALTLFSSCNYI